MMDLLPRWLVWFPNAVVELSSAPTEITVEHDNTDLGLKVKHNSNDYLRSARPELGGRILFFPPSEVTLHSILEQPAQLGANVADIPFSYPDDDAEDIARNAERERSISEWSQLSLKEQYQDYLSRGFSATDAWEFVRS